MATSWPKQRRLIGTKVQRVDGPDKSTGRAKYTFDINRPGLLYAAILRCPHAHAKIEALETGAAEKMPGVKAVQAIAQVGKECYYAGDEVVALAADTEEHLQDALRAIKVKYQVLDHLVTEQDALKNATKKTVGGAGTSNVAAPGEAAKGNVEQGFKEADAVVEGEYGVPTICHQCLESHGLVAEWDKDDNLTVWCSTQAVTGTAQALAQVFKIAPTKVKCITHYMGGGFGSKFGPDIQGITAAQLAKKAGAPVKLMLDREEEITVGGNRPSAYGKVKIGGKKDGTITAYEVDCYGTPGHAGGATVNLGLLPYVYMDAIPNWKRKHTVVRINAGSARAMRAPGHPQNCVLTEGAIDDLAAILGLDPLQVRLKNLPPNDPAAAKNDPTAWLGQRNTIYTAEIEIAAKLANWKQKWHPPGQGKETGPIKHGIGMALHTWGGSAVGGDPPPNECTVIIAKDGSVTAQTSSQDLGTAQRTITALVTAEILGLKVSDVITRIGENQYGRSSGSGGSTTCPSQAPATLIAAQAALDDLFTKIAPKLQAKKADLAAEDGKIVDKASKKSYAWKEACARLGMDEAKGTGGWSSQLAGQPENRGVSSVQVGGVQIAEVTVDTETGVVKCTQVVAVQDVGMVVNLLACESQVAGGVIMGVNYALFEDRIMDRATGRQVNADMEFYKLGGISDMPKVIVHMHDMPERGVIGIGEPPTISTCAAVGNAIFNAIGVRVGEAPYTPARVLERLARRPYTYRVTSNVPTPESDAEASAQKGGKA
jgi:xanthine dehydrogenase YagR molybdenum-binding subunit